MKRSARAGSRTFTQATVVRLLAAGALLGAAACGNGGGGGDGGMPAARDLAVAPPYTVPVFDDVRIGSDGSKPNFQRATAMVHFDAGPFARAKLVTDLSSTCYPFDKWTTNKPPPGQNWPADCDAFDRNYELFLDEPKAPGDRPGIELVRAITPFGGPLHIETDITDVVNGAPGDHRLGVLIPTYSDGAGKVSGSNGGWNVSARIELVPGPAPHKVLAVIPLFYGNQNGPDAPAAIPFTIPANTRSGRLEWRATGHGGGKPVTGCIGPAEEFCDRMHTLSVDGKELDRIEPWRDDCDTLCTIAHQGPANGGFDYCKQNPCGAIQSVKAPRANWCPGSVTPPFTFTKAPLAAPGAHTFSWSISSFGAGGTWRLSALYFAFAE